MVPLMPRGVRAERFEQVGDGSPFGRPIDDDAERAFAGMLRQENDGVIEFGLVQIRRRDQKLAGERGGPGNVRIGRQRRMQQRRRQDQRRGE